MRRALAAAAALAALGLLSAAPTSWAADGPCTEAARYSMPVGESHSHADIDQHQFSCRLDQVAFLPLVQELQDRQDVILGEMDVKADKAVVAVAYPEAGFLLFDVADPSQPKFLSWYRSSECEGLLVDVDCGAFVDLSADGKTVFISMQDSTAIPGDDPAPGQSGVAKPMSYPGIEVVDVSDPTSPQLTQPYLVDDPTTGGVHTARSHVVPGKGEYVFAVHNGVGIHIAKVDDTIKPILIPETTLTLAEAHDIWIADDPIDKKTYMYIAGGFSTGFLIYDVSDPADPKGPLGEWDATPGCQSDWYSHTIDVTYRGNRRVLTMPHEGFDFFGNQPDEDQAEGCGKLQGNGDKPGPMWIVDITDFSKLGQAGDSEALLQSKSRDALITTWTNAAGRAAGALTFSPHNQQIVGDWISLSQYHGGVVLLDAAAALDGRDERPSELAFAVPHGTPVRPLFDFGVPGAATTLGPFVTVFTGARPIIWDQYWYKGYLLAADMTGGFYSFKYNPDGPIPVYGPPTQPPPPAPAAETPPPVPAGAGAVLGDKKKSPATKKSPAKRRLASCLKKAKKQKTARKRKAAAKKCQAAYRKTTKKKAKAKAKPRR
jgi:hypothetical protein